MVNQMSEHGTISRYTNDNCRCEPCSQVNAEYNAEYRQAHSLEIAECKSAYYVENKDLIDAANAQWGKEHSDAIRKHKAKYRQANRVTIRAKEKVREQSTEGLSKKVRREQKRRAIKLNQFIEDVDPQILYKTHGGMCGICKEFIIGKFHVDHIIPISKGGMHGYVNTQPAHPLCNLKKGDKLQGELV